MWKQSRIIQNGFFDFLGVKQTQKNDIVRGDIRQTRSNLYPAGFKSGKQARTDIVDHELCTTFVQIHSHGFPHMPQADKTNFAHTALRSFVLGDIETI